MESQTIRQAHMMSTYPNLLQALVDLLEDAERLGINDSKFSGVAVQARQAIATARGGQ